MRGWKSVLSSAPTQDRDLFETTHGTPMQSLRSNHLPVSRIHSHKCAHTQLTERFLSPPRSAPEHQGRRESVRLP